MSIAWQRRAAALRGWALAALLLLLWWACAHWGWSRSPLLVAPGAVWQTAMAQVRSGALLTALGASLARDLAGFAVGALAGLGVGMTMGLSRRAAQVLGPSFHTVKQISLFAWIPLLSILLGLGEPAKVAFIALATFFPVVLNTFEGVRSVAPAHLEVARVLGLGRTQRITRVLLPAAAPSILCGLHLGLIYAWLGTLGAEYLLASGVGIGNMLIDGRENFWMDQVILGVLVVGLVGFALNAVAGRIERRLLRGSHGGGGGATTPG